MHISGTFRIIKFACKVITNYKKNKGEIRKKRAFFVNLIILMLKNTDFGQKEVKTG